ncbi:unnamed protein product [Lota lota]
MERSCLLEETDCTNRQPGGATCVLLGFMTSLAAAVDIFSLAALSVPRHRIAAWHPPRPPTCEAVTTALVWLVSVAMALPKVTHIAFCGGCTWSVERAEPPSWCPTRPTAAPSCCARNRCSGGPGGGGPSRRRRRRPPQQEGRGAAGGAASTLAFAVGSLAAILSVCPAPRWNPPLYFLLARCRRGYVSGFAGVGETGEEMACGAPLARHRHNPPSPPVPRTPLAHRLTQ